MPVAAKDVPLLAIVGPTASGKSAAAIEVARRIGAEIVSVDSMLVYRGMDVGTAKPSAAERTRVPHHLIDVVDPEESFSVAEYQALAKEAVGSIRMRGRRALLAGGTGLYFRAIVDELEFPPTDPAARARLEAEAEKTEARAMHARLEQADPVAAAKIEPDNLRRTIRALEVVELTGRPFSSYAEAWDRYPPDRVRAAGVAITTEVLERRIRARVAGMLDAGFVEEVRALAGRGLSGWLTASQAIGYAEIVRHLDGESALDEAVAGTVKRTKALARRQMGWFRRDPRIRWFEAGEDGAWAVVEELWEYLSE